MKKYDNYKDSGIEWIGEIPENWSVKKTFHYFKAEKGKKAAQLTKEFCGTIEGIYPVYSGQTENNGIMSSINEYEFNFSDDGCLLSTTVGAKAMSINFIQGKFSLSQNCMVITSRNKSEILNKFFFYQFQPIFNFHRNLIPDHMQPSFRMDDLYQFKIIIPSKEEQIVIANFLDHKTTQIDHLIAKKEQFIQLLEEERVAVINQAVTKGLDPSVAMKDSGIEWLGEIPEHWEVKKLKQIFNSSKGLTITKENLESDGIPCINYGEIHSKFGFEVDIDKHQLKCVNPTYLESDYKSLIQTGDFVFADTSEDVSGAGNFTYLKSNHEIFAGYHTIILRAFCDIEPRYFAYQFDSIPNRTQIRQSVKGIKVFSITQGILKNTSLWIPPIDEQKQIIEFLDIETDRIVSLKNSTRKEIELLKEYKTALISEVVTGKVDVRNEKLN